MPDQLDMFGEAATPAPDKEPAGLRLAGPVLDDAQQRDAIARIEQLALTPFRFGQWTGKRETVSFGWYYDFEHGGVARADPMPDWLIATRQRAAAVFDDDPAHYEQALLIRYKPGAVIGWHRDRPNFGTVIGLSLGTAAQMRLRHRVGQGFERATFPLTPGHAYRLSGDARDRWEHSIAALDQPRWSITFRTLRSAIAG